MIGLDTSSSRTSQKCGEGCSVLIGECQPLLLVQLFVMRNPNQQRIGFPRPGRIGRRSLSQYRRDAIHAVDQTPEALAPRQLPHPRKIGQRVGGQSGAAINGSPGHQTHQVVRTLGEHLIGGLDRLLICSGQFPDSHRERFRWSRERRSISGHAGSVSAQVRIVLALNVWKLAHRHHGARTTNTLGGSQVVCGDLKHASHRQCVFDLLSTQGQTGPTVVGQNNVAGKK